MNLQMFQKMGWINSETLIIIETDAKNPEKIPTGFSLVKERNAGRNLFLFLKQGE